MIHFQVTTNVRPAATASYRPDDYTLVVGPSGRTPPGMAQVSVDTATLLLLPNGHRLTGLDAYTNAERWERRVLERPVVDREAALNCAEHFDVHGVAHVDAGPLRWTYSPAGSLLRIQVDEGRVTTRVRCLGCMVCGLGVGGELIELWVEDVAGVRP